MCYDDNNIVFNYHLSSKKKSVMGMMHLIGELEVVVKKKNLSGRTCYDAKNNYLCQTHNQSH
jgi:hypothetical protein